MMGGKLPSVPDLVAIDLPGGPQWLDALRAVWDAGDAALPVDQRLAPEARAAVLAVLGAARVIDRSGSTGLTGGVPVEPGDALVMATSGTTGAPKGVVLTHDAVQASARATSARLGVDPDRHRWLACLPLNHVGGLSVVTKALHTGTGLSILPGFDRDAVLAASGPDVLVSLVPTALARVADASWHTVVLGGSAAPEGLGANVHTTYGLTETGSGVVYDGSPLDGVEVDVDAATGEIRLRGPMLLRCYRDGFVPLDAGGWFSTGDAGSWGADGRLRVEGRLSELIVTGGENVWPTAVERILSEHPAVADVAVTGRPDPEWGERVVAWVVPVAGHDAPVLEELRALVRDRFASFAAPRQLVVVDTLPKTSIGKLRRDALAIRPSGDIPS
jgi:O-succinylbenzoic acid--CoA ligase